MGKLTARRAGFPPARLAPPRPQIMAHPPNSPTIDTRSPSPSRIAGVSPACLAFLGMVLASSASAQSAANFDTKTLAPDTAPGAAQIAKPVPKVAGPVSATPSRQVGAAELDPYLDSLSSVFLIRGRATDPFGQPQDPDAKPVVKASVAKAVHRAAPIQATPFSDIVRLIVVTTIMPGEKRFLVGTRSFKQGDQIPLNFRNRPIRVQVTEVTSRQIGFRNLDSGETASRKLDLLPVGMTPGSHGIATPGMVADRLNAPIELEAGDPAPESFRTAN